MAANITSAGNARYNNGYSAGVNAGRTVVARSITQTYTLNPNGDNKWGSETITFTFPTEIVGMYYFTQSAAAAYCYLTKISISGNAISMTFGHGHGVNQSTNTVTCYCFCRG